MMFMIPMPPTRREIPATAPRKTTRVLVGLFKGVKDLLLIEDGEVVGVGQAVAQSKDGLNLLDGLVDRFDVAGLD